MAMLGVIHRAVLGRGPEQIQEFFRLDDVKNHPTGRNNLRRHDKQVVTYRTGSFLESTAHSILGLVDVYNMLPAGIVATDDVHAFQAKLQALMKLESSRNSDWETMYSPRLALHNHPLRRLMNGVCSTTGNGATDIGMGCDNNDGWAAASGRTDYDGPPAWW